MDLSNNQTRTQSILSNIKPIYLIILVVLIIVIESVWAYQAWTSQTTPQTLVTDSPKQNNISNTISLTAPKSQFKIGEVIPVGINIESSKLSAGADLIIHYDANLLNIAPGSINAPVSLGTIFDQYPINQVDEKNGVITVSGITNNPNGVSPKGLFGTILFQTKAVGNAKIFLEFTKGKTNDTNLIDIKTSVDVLEAVKNLDITIIP